METTRKREKDRKQERKNGKPTYRKRARVRKTYPCPDIISIQNTTQILMKSMNVYV